MSVGSGRRLGTGQGSGFVVDKDGHILTNNHVVQGATGITVSFANGTTTTAHLVSTSAANDLAVIKVSQGSVKDIEPLTLGDSSLVKPGQMAIAIGSPFGLENSITVGVISGVNRTIGSTGRPIPGALQTDASINPGNSGGPLLNSSGQVIGVNTAVESGSGGSTGVGFAVSSNTAKTFLANVKAGTVTASTRPWLGITGTPVTPEITQLYGLTATRGVYLISVVEGSPAARAGLVGNREVGVAGDVIISINGVALGTVEDLVAQLSAFTPGDSVNLLVLRNGESRQVHVTLGGWPGT